MYDEEQFICILSICYMGITMFHVVQLWDHYRVGTEQYTMMTIKKTKITKNAPYVNQSKEVTLCKSCSRNGLMHLRSLNSAAFKDS